MGYTPWNHWGSTRLSDFTFTFHFRALVKEMAIHSSVLAWRIPGTEETDGLPSMGSHRVRHNWSNLAAAAASNQNFTLEMSYVSTLFLSCHHHFLLFLLKKTIFSSLSSLLNNLHLYLTYLLFFFFWLREELEQVVNRNDEESRETLGHKSRGLVSSVICWGKMVFSGLHKCLPERENKFSTKVWFFKS